MGAYNNMFWPAKYLIDKDGYIRYTHFGEGAYDETEQKIRELLAEAEASLGSVSSDIYPAPQVDPITMATDLANNLTRELYAGYSRNYGALRSRTQPSYVLPGDHYRQPDAAPWYAVTQGSRAGEMT